MRGEDNTYKKLKWGMIQPLTGGMYIGAYQSIGHHADFVISFNGLAEPKLDKNGNVTNCGNEYHLLKWLESKNADVPYYTFDNIPMFPTNYNEISEFIYRQLDFPIVNSLNTKYKNAETLNFENTDIVFAVPVCSGLSALTASDQSAKDVKNCNMMFITKFVLNQIRPKAYVFENAPALTETKGKSVRMNLEKLASEAGYSVCYFKTNTCLHGIPQNRPRTFVIMTSFASNVTPDMIENIHTDLNEYMSYIPEDASQQDERLEQLAIHRFINKFISKRHPELYDTEVELTKYIYKNYFDEVIDFCKDSSLTEKEAYTGQQVFEHIDKCESEGRGFWFTPLQKFKNNYFPALQSRSLFSIYYDNKFEQLLSTRQMLHIMGLPHDFVLYGDIARTHRQVGQNVPVCTARWIADVAKKMIASENNETNETNGMNYLNNIKGDILEL